MKEFIYKQWPLVGIVLIWLVFASPYFLKGLIPFPSDYLVSFFAPWNAYSEFAAGPVKNNAIPDVITQIYPWKSLVIDIWKSGSVPLWNPYSFSGTPLLANYQSAVLSPLNILYLILPFIDAWSIQILLAPLFAGIFTYIFSRSLKINVVGSVISSLAFMFSGFITTWMVYGTLPYAILFLPLALFSIEKFYETKKWYFASLLTLSIPLSFFSGHFQISLYFLIIVVCYSIFKYIAHKNLKSLVLSLMSILFGLLISSPQLLPSIELYSMAVRSSIFQKIEVVPWGYLSTFIAPDFLGNPVTRNDWFGHYAEWNAYIGFVPLMLGFYSLRKINKTIIFFILVSVVSILLAFQSPILDLLVALKIPVLSTSAASRIIVLFSFSVSILSGFGFEIVTEDVKNRKTKNLIVWALLFLLALGSLWLVVISKQFMPIDKILIAKSNLKLPTLIFALFAVAIVFAAIVKAKLRIVWFSIIIILLVTFDVLRFSTKWMPFEPRGKVYPETLVSQFISSKASYDRVFGNFGAETAVTLKAASVEGYDPLYIERYGELIDAAPDGVLRTPERLGVQLAKNGKYTSIIVNLLGVKYFVNKVADGRMPWAYPVWKFPLDQFEIVYSDEAYQVFENKAALPRAFLVSDFKTIEDSQKILSTLLSDKTDLRKTAILEENPNINLGSTGSAVIKKYTPNKINVQTNSVSSTILVLTDPYYPGWKARVDGIETKIYRTDFAFRGIVVPKGQHNVIFSYEPNSFVTSVPILIVGILGSIMTGIYLQRQKNVK